MSLSCPYYHIPKSNIWHLFWWWLDSFLTILGKNWYHFLRTNYVLGIVLAALILFTTILQQPCRTVLWPMGRPRLQCSCSRPGIRPRLLRLQSQALLQLPSEPLKLRPDKLSVCQPSVWHRKEIEQEWVWGYFVEVQLEEHLTWSQKIWAPG